MILVTKKLIPAFHEDQYGPCPPVFAIEKYDDNGDEKTKDKGHVGMVEYTGFIQIHAICANDLPKADLLSDSDPYVAFKNKNGQSVKTKVIDNNNDPNGTTFSLSVNENEPVFIEIYDEDDHTKDDLLCTQQLNIHQQCKVGEEVKFKMNMNG